MTRWASTNNATAAAQPAVALATLADLDFSDGTIRIHDGYGTIVFGGNTYTGVGDYASFDVIEESTDGIAKTIVLTLTGVPGPILTESITQDTQGREVTLYIALLNVNTFQLIDTPEIIWEGRMDYPTVEISQGKTSISMRCESRLNREPLVARYTDVDQQLAFPGDSFFDLVWQIPYATTGWGGTSVQYPANTPPAGRTPGTQPPHKPGNNPTQ